MADKNIPDSRGRVSGGSYKKRRFGRCNKRKKIFYANKNSDCPPAKKLKKTSFKKVQTDIEVNISNVSDTKFRLIDINVVYPGLEDIVSCKLCHGQVTFSEKDFQGLGFTLVMTCSACGQENFINSNKKVGQQKKAYEVNKRLEFAIQELGQGDAGSEIFCEIMDLPAPVAHIM